MEENASITASPLLVITNRLFGEELAELIPGLIKVEQGKNKKMELSWVSWPLPLIPVLRR